MAIDLELWFIRSLLLVCIASSLGPKIVMIRKMVRLFRRYTDAVVYARCRQTTYYYSSPSL